MSRAVKGLEALGVLRKVAPGFFDRNTGTGYVARFTAEEPFVKSCAERGVRPSMILVRERERLIELRKKTKKGVKLLPWPRSAQAEKNRMTQNLRLINEALRDTFVALHVSDETLEEIQDRLQRKREESRYIDFYDKQLRRIFNDNPRSGGRFYGGWWQNVPSEYRKHIHICHRRGYPSYTFEADYSSMQPRILYAWEGVDLSADPYSIYPGDPKVNAAARSTVKIVMLQMLNASRETALKAARQEIVENYGEAWSHKHPKRKRPEMTVDEMLPKGCPKLEELMLDIERAHPAIRKHLYDSGTGKRLMYEDSQIAEAVMIRMLKLGAVALPIHDSFLVRRGWDTDLERCMKEEFARATGAKAELKFDQTEYQAKGKVIVHFNDPDDRRKRDEENERDRKTHAVYTTLRDDWMMERETKAGAHQQARHTPAMPRTNPEEVGE
jgi:hypothetical protein